jgi:hypothetical protein
MKNVFGSVAVVVIVAMLALFANMIVAQNDVAEKATAECTVNLAGKYHADYVARVCANAVVNK